MSAITTAPLPTHQRRRLPRLAHIVERTSAVFAFAVAMTGHSEQRPYAMPEVMEAEIRRLKL